MLREEGERLEKGMRIEDRIEGLMGYEDEDVIRNWNKREEIVMREEDWEEVVEWFDSLYDGVKGERCEEVISWNDYMKGVGNE